MKAIIKPIKIDSILEYKNFKTLDDSDLYTVTTIFTGYHFTKFQLSNNCIDCRLDQLLFNNTDLLMIKVNGFLTTMTH